MTDRYIRAMLRAATAEKILNGWQGPHYRETRPRTEDDDEDTAIPTARTYTVAPKDGPAEEWDEGRVTFFVAGLEHTGVAPLYRDSEPAEMFS